LVRGPVVHALDTLWWLDAKLPAPFEVGREVAVIGSKVAGQESEPAILERAAPAGLLGPALLARVRLVTGESVAATFLPFANIGKWYRDGEPKPERGRRAFSYAVWLQDAASPEFAAAIQEREAFRELVRNSIDVVVIGDEASEKAHVLRGNGGSGPFRGRNYRHAGGGWFSWRLKVRTEGATAIAVTYWGGETDRRVFEVLIDDVKVATETLLQNRPGEFFEVRYAVPLELIRGRTNALGQKVDSVTVKFQALEGSTAGGVFGVRTMAEDEPKTGGRP
jgi:hypothetical protein